MGAQAQGEQAHGRWASGASRHTGAGRWGAGRWGDGRAGHSGAKRAGRAGASDRGAWQAGTRCRQVVERTAGASMGARGAGRERAGRAAWACLCAQAGRAGWSAGLVLVHSAPGSVFDRFDSVFFLSH